VDLSLPFYISFFVSLSFFSFFLSLDINRCRGKIRLRKYSLTRFKSVSTSESGFSYDHRHRVSSGTFSNRKGQHLMDQHLQFNPHVNTKFLAIYNMTVRMMEWQHTLDDIGFGLRTI
jgi:hypothetical protein